MAKFELGALDEYVSMLKNLEKDKTVKILEMSVYEGASIVADEISKEIDTLPVNSDPYKGITKEQKKDLKDGFGISPMQRGDDINVKIGFAGYGKHPTKKYPKGIPTPMLARSILSGTSFRAKNPFVKRAVTRVRKKTIDKMDEVINEQFKKEIK